MSPKNCVIHIESMLSIENNVILPFFLTSVSHSCEILTDQSKVYSLNQLFELRDSTHQTNKRLNFFSYIFFSFLLIWASLFVCLKRIIFTNYIELTIFMATSNSYNLIFDPQAWFPFSVWFVVLFSPHKMCVVHRQMKINVSDNETASKWNT